MKSGHKSGHKSSVKMSQNQTFNFKPCGELMFWGYWDLYWVQIFTNMHNVSLVAMVVGKCKAIWKAYGRGIEEEDKLWHRT